MNFALGYLAGILTMPALVAMYWLYALMCGQTRRYAGSTIMYDHPVGDPEGVGTHTHEYSGWVPIPVRAWRVKRDAKRCVYTKLGDTPGAVWDRAVIDHGHTVMGLDLEELDEGEEAYLKAEIGMMLYRGINNLPERYGSTKAMDKLAREQLAATAHR